MNFPYYKQLFETYLENKLPKVIPTNLYEPYHYIMHLDGKRIRPILMMAAHESYAPLSDEVMTAALAVELFHNFSLMHDDIMDRSDLRRGFPTVHKKYDENSAILSGDAMLIVSYQLLEKIRHQPYFFDIYSLYNKTAIEICTGQRLDMNFENEVIVSELEYLIMIEHKTAVLLATSMKMGAIIARASSMDIESAYQFGLNIGMAFQIQDDLLDSFGDTAHTGKAVGGDITNNKKTLLLIYALQNAHKTQKELLYNWIQTTESSTHKIEEVTQIFQDSGAKNYVENKRNVYYEKALGYLDQMAISKEKKELFLNFAHIAVERDK